VTIPTDSHGGEALDRGKPVVGEIRVADRGYANAQAWQRFLQVRDQRTDFIVRMRWNTIALVDEAGGPFDLVTWLRTRSPESETHAIRYGRPEIFNTDQGSQFTSAAFTGLLLDNAIAVSMDGRGAWRDNVFVERLWRSVKYEEVNLRAYDGVGQAPASLSGYFTFYNTKGPHSSLDARTPGCFYYNHLPQTAAA
jgi:putative transposase